MAIDKISELEKENEYFTNPDFLKDLKVHFQTSVEFLNRTFIENLDEVQMPTIEELEEMVVAIEFFNNYFR